VEYAAELIAFIRELSMEHVRSGPHDHGYDVSHTTLSTTSISGGTGLNVIPNRCEFTFDIRALPQVDVRALVERIRHHARSVLLPDMRAVAPDATIEIETLAEFVGLSTEQDHPAVAFVKRLTGRNDHAKVAYGTEAGLFSEGAGVASVVCGPGSIEQAHKPDEYIEISQVERCRAFIDRLASELEHSSLAWA
jgi:acetylornithine deacetylase